MIRLSDLEGGQCFQRSTSLHNPLAIFIESFAVELTEESLNDIVRNASWTSPWKQKMKVMGLMTGTAVKLLEEQAENFIRDSILYILYVRLSAWSSAASKNYAGKRVHVLPSPRYGNVQHTKLRQCLHILPWNSLPSCIPSTSSPAFFLRSLNFHFESDRYSFAPH